MMRIFALLLVAACAWAGRLDWSVEIDPGDVSVSREGGYSLILTRGMHPSGDPGAPMLPSVPLSFVIDPGAVDVAFTIELSDPVRFDISSPVTPACTLRPVGSPGRQLRVPDSRIYLSGDPWPAEKTSGERTGRLGGFTLASCIVTPWDYTPLDGGLVLYTNIDVGITWSGSDAAPSLTGEQIASAASRVALLVENPQDVASSGPPERSDRAGDAIWTVICDSSFSSDLEPLRSWWEDTLGSASILTIQEVESFPGGDPAEKLRNAIEDLWLSHGAVYVLLAGDESLVPVRMIYSICEGMQDYIPSDHYFSDLDGNWDASGDGVYGQPDDDLDLYMDVLLGRALFSTHGQAGVFVEKTLGYASDPPEGDWRTTALLCGAVLFEEIGYIGGKGCDTLAAALPAGWDIVSVYEEPSIMDGSDTHIQYLQDGTGWNYYAGHGNRNGIWWSYEPVTMMNTSLAQSLANGARAGIHTSIACSPGAFQGGIQSCAEALLQNPDGGAVSVTFNTSYGWEGYWPDLGASEWMCIYLTRAVFLEHLPTLGSAFAAAKDQRVPFIHGPYDRNLQSILSWTAFHDPALSPLGVSPDSPIPPVPLAIGAPWPNPATRGAPFTFDVEYEGGAAELSAWDMAGRLVWRRDVTGPGTYLWDGFLDGGERAPAGVYIISARRGDYILSRRVTLLD